MIGLQYSVLGIIARNFVQYRCVKEIENSEQQRNLLSDMHQNLINISLWKDATKYKNSFDSIHQFFSCKQTDRQKFYKNSEIVFRTSQKV